MFLLTILKEYIFWHYTTALVSYLRIYKNFAWFISQYFSLTFLLGSLFLPYKRMTQKVGRVTDIEGWMKYIIVNVVSRLVGFLVRFFIILMGITSLILFNLAAIICYGLWLLSPVLIIYCLFYGFYLMII